MTRSGTSSRAAQFASAAGTAVRVAPGVAGPVLVCVGLWMLAPFLGVTAAGIILWALDRRIP
jgi:hypothetical protein